MEYNVAFFFLGPTVTFFSLLMNNTNILPVTYGLLSYAYMPLAILNAMYLGFEIFNPEGKKRALQVFGISGIIYYIALIGWPQFMFETTPGGNPLEMLDISLRNVVLVSALFYILCVIFVLARGFLRLRKRIEGADRERATNLAISFLMFAFAAILDTVMTSELMVIARMIMAISTIYFYKGFYIKKEAQTPQVQH